MTDKRSHAETIANLNALNQSNQAFVRNLMLAMFGDSVFKDPVALERKLNEIINDIAQAERDGMTAEAFFGHHPRRASQKILAALPNQKLGEMIKANWRIFCLTLLFACFLSSISLRTVNGTDHAYFSILSTFLTPTLLTILIWFDFKLISWVSFKQKGLKFLTTFALSFATIYLAGFLFRNPIRWLSFEVPRFWITCQFIAMLIYLLIMIILTIRNSRNIHRKVETYGQN
jgi:hypothetical protein